jgi:hypothetical protein
MHKKAIQNHSKPRVLARELASELKKVSGGEGNPVMATGGPGNWDITNVSADKDNQG